MDEQVSEDALLGGKIRFFQPQRGYRVAVDPIFLAAAVPAQPGEQILDVGAGTGAAMLCLAARMPDCRLVGVELQRDLMRIANTNIEANGFAQRAEMIAGDLATLPPRLMAASFDHVMTNPPFLESDAATASPLRQRADAHVEGQLDLSAWLTKCLLMLKTGGCLTLIHRADRLGELLGALEGKIGDTVIYPLWPKADGRPAKRIIIQGQKGAKGPLKLAQGLVVHEQDGRYTQLASGVLRAGKPMPLRPPRRQERPARPKAPPRARPSATDHGFAPIGKVRTMLEAIKTRLRWPPFGKRGPIVPVIRLAGVIGAAGGLRGEGLSFHSLNTSIERAFKIKGAKAVALAINSPGGSPVQSALIGERIRTLAAEKDIPVIAFVEDVGASGGYWLALAADEIFADANSIVGSIGVISAGFGFVEAMQKLGVERRVYTAGEFKSLLDPFRAEDPEGVTRLKSIMEDCHDNFRTWVRERRGDRLKGEDSELFEGQVWTGKKALDIGLIDGIGHLHAVLKERFGDDLKLPLVTRPRPWWQRRLRMGGATPGVDLTEPRAWVDGALDSLEERALWARYGL